MKKFRLGKYFISLAAFIGLALSPLPVFAQHGGGGGGHSGGGGGGGFHGGGGGVHSSGGAGGGFSHSSAGEARGGAEARGYEGGSRSAGGASSYRGGAEAGRGGALSARGQSSNIRPAINDGQWHSFGGSSRSSNLVARSTGTTEGFRSFGSSRGEAGFVGGGFRGAGFGFRGGFGGFGFGRGCCWGGWGFGIGFPYWGFGWGPAWAFWNPWWYGPYWYGPYYGGWSGYYGSDYGYDDYSDVWSSNPPPYRQDDSQDNSASQRNSQIYPARPDSDDDGLNMNPGSDSVDSSQNGAPPRNSNAPTAPRVQTSVVVPAVI